MFWLICVTVKILLWLECMQETSAPQINAVVNNALFGCSTPTYASIRFCLESSISCVFFW